ncbi:hypothetical protein [Microvirga thermotolerans]|uniref:Uncharacterized protein n=1 Tax=Microvirga thermotolerans TaxID=2651334 RepID=A0A5P9JUJ6_9HYPH|nr:hypothetical protein [Microvirga thermotolerans]QFU14855.1 hypothetical protein GDR74_00735 [Microvirga thermotolerans]
MSPFPPAIPVPFPARLLPEGPWRFAPSAAGSRSVLDRAGDAPPPPAAAERAQTAFEAVGLFLLVLIGLAAVWIMVRGRV